MRSIRADLMTRLVLGSTIVIGVAGTTVWAVATRSLERQLDENLDDRVQGLASILFQTSEQVSFEFSGQLMPEYERPEHPAFFELRFDDGELLEGSESLGGRTLELELPPSSATAFWSAPLPDGRPGRYALRRIEIHHVYPEEGPQRPQARRVDIALAFGTEELRAAKVDLALRCGGASLVLLLLIAGVASHAVARGLEPTQRVAAALDAIDVERLPPELGAGPLPEELQPVARKTDALIRRVQQAIERERRTSANIAHELRTPISEILTVSEVAIRHDAADEGSRKALGTVRDVAWRMGRSVASLLELARLEMGSQRVSHVSIDAQRLLDDAARPMQAARGERGIALAGRVDADVRIEADPDVLAIVVSNLLSNALDYSPRDGTVTWHAARRGDAWELAIENETRDLVPADLDALREPFWRKDGARADKEHAGLGLALSHALAEAAGLELAFELVDGRFRATLSGPSRRGRNGRAYA